jgi:hypothetical protein
MTAITIPASIKPLFAQVSEPVSVTDEQGNVLGFYTPMRQVTKEDYARADSLFTTEEIEAGRRSGPGRPLKDILSDLQRRYGS